MVDTTTQPTLKAIGQELRVARRARGWTQHDLVTQLGGDIPVNTYGGYEQGIRPCSITRLIHICDTLGITVSCLLDRAMRRLVAEPHSPQVGDPVVVHGRIVSIDEGIALVEVYRSWPLGMRVPVQCGALDYDEGAAGGDSGVPG